MASEVRVAHCPHCGNRSTQQVLYPHRKCLEDGQWDQYYLTECQTCRGVLLYHITAGTLDFRHADLLWPDLRADAELLSNLPETVACCYQEAIAIRGRAPNAFAGQIRRAIEALCDERGAREGTLQVRIRELAEKGEIPPTLADMTTVLRLLGNIGVHAGRSNVSADYVPIIDEFFRTVVEYVYLAPKKVRNVKQKVEQMKAMSGD